jgi:protein-S-isoprenylcysteine O-methyltransferase Ste14
MNQHLRAGALTAGMIVIVLATTAFFYFLSTVITANMVPWIIVVLGITACVICIYHVFLAQIRFEDKLKSLVDKK